MCQHFVGIFLFSNILLTINRIRPQFDIKILSDTKSKTLAGYFLNSHYFITSYTH
nr:Hypothetical protein [Aeromonas sp.]